MNQSMWQLFVYGLQQVGILAVNPATFEASSGLAIADWEIMDYTGLTQPTGKGTPIPSKVFSWADPMPANAGKFYQPGSSLSDSYSLFLNSLSVSSADAATITQARANQLLYQMSDASGNSWPGYAISPGLNDFLMASLQSVSRSMAPQIDFTLNIPPAAPVSAGVTLMNAKTAGKASLLQSAVEAAPAPEGDASPPFFGFDNHPIVVVQPVVRNRSKLGSSASVADSSLGGAPAVSSAATIRFQAQTAQMFSIQPSRWFSGAILSAFYNRIDPASALAGKTILGPGGFLSSRASQILVAFKRLVTVSGSPSMVSQIQSGVQQATNAFNIGSFYFSPSASVNQATPGTIIFQDNTNAPSVIGLSVDSFAP